MQLPKTFTALITPFRDGTLDKAGLRANIGYQIQEGIEGIVLLGSTGEETTLSDREKAEALAIAVEETQGKIPLWVGTGAASTQETIEKTQRAHAAGAQGALVITPYYNKPTQEGIYRHFATLTQACDLPIMLYHNPSRSGVSIDISTLLRLATLPHIVGIKESSGNAAYWVEMFQKRERHVPHFQIWSGEDALTLPLMALGAAGVVSVASNLFPKEISKLVHRAAAGDFPQAREMQASLFPLFQALSIETNPIPIKAAMEMCGFAAGEGRLPLTPLQDSHQRLLYEVLQNLGKSPKKPHPSFSDPEILSF